MKRRGFDPEDEGSDDLHRESVLIILVLTLLVLSVAGLSLLAFQMHWVR